MLKRTAFVIGACMALAACGKSHPNGAAALAASTAPPAPKGEMTAQQVANLQRGDLSCPPKSGMPAPAAGAPVDDIVGVRPGMSYAEAAARVMCSAPLMVLEPDNDHGFDVKTSGYKVRQGFVGHFAEAHHELNGRDYARQMEQEAMERGLNVRKERTASGTSRWYVGTMGVPGAEVVTNASREEHFAADQQPTVATVGEALLKKYGQPSWISDAPGNQPGEMRWAYSPDGQRAVAGSQLANGCAGPYGPDDGFQIGESCGVVVSARVSPSGANPKLVERLSVGVVDSAGTLNLIQATEKTLAARRSGEQDAQARSADKDVAAPKL